MTTSLAVRVRWLLDHSDIKAREASRLAGFPSEAYVGMLLREDVTDPRTSTIEPLAKAFGADPGWLAFGVGDPPSVESLRTLGAGVARARSAARSVGADPTASDLDVAPSPTLPASHEAA